MSSGEVQDIRSQLIEIKRLLLEAVVEEQRLYQRYSEASREAQRWSRRAELALSSREGSEELARAALGRSSDHNARASQLHQQYLTQKEYVEATKVRLRELEMRARQQPMAAGRLPDVREVEHALSRIEQQEERSRAERAQLAARVELERDALAEKLEALEREDLLERQLAELKQRLGRS